ncbi:CBL-interacting serine/threonine-protein kinase 9-like isoform X3 [Dendrobium catenatum]|uniref:CBL-interacting serine/threonine-protein kinase 9-like isoform X3 n=1 Tax=Dendrobium catenatum TaxID=906689 RepID=UPI0010A06367|nr:CBL-interacting serine/threonine-protein kinase 9-like isoform X3 [Dendrobium catenatum]
MESRSTVQPRLRPPTLAFAWFPRRLASSSPHALSSFSYRRRFSLLAWFFFPRIDDLESGHQFARDRTRVGRYELGRTLGEGSFAKVKFARNVQTGENVAIKVLDKNQVLRHKMVEQIKREISTMKLIKHPNVVQLYEVMASKTKIYIVLEFVDGGELFDKIVNSGRLKEDEARRYFHQLINAVDYCHSRGVYHRDLKGDGLLHTACGTPNYVAPEVLDDKGYDGRASDIWSCGVILFVLMAGYLPFDESNLMALYKKICKAKFSSPSWFSSSAKKLIKRILDPNPLSRITIAEILEDEWFKKGYKPANFEQMEGVSLDDVDAVFNDSQEHLVTEKKEKPESMNAFALISRSEVFNLGNLFEKQTGIVKRETSFTSPCSPNEIMSKLEETAKPLGFNVHKHNYKMKLKGDRSGRKGYLSVATEVFEVAPSLHMVELRKTGGDTLEFHKFYKKFSTGIKDIVWKTGATHEETSSRPI